MPLAIASVLRWLLIAIIQSGAFIAIQSLIMKLLEKNDKRNQEELGLDEEDAKSHTANAFLDLALLSGITYVSLKTKLPVKIAAWLGFTTKGFKPRALSPKGEAKVRAAGEAKVSVPKAKVPTIEEAAPVIAAAKGSTLAKASQIATIVIGALGVPVGVGLLITNTIDFGAWSSSAYQSTFQKILAKFGLEADKDASSPKSISVDMFNKLYAAMQAEGVTSFKDPYNEVTYPLTRENLINTADKIAGQINFEKGKTSFKELMGAFVALSIFEGKKAPVVQVSTGASSGGTSGSTGSKVFMGIVSQGTLGEQLSFVARPDDVIESISELQEAAQNNLSSYLLTLPGRIVYEIKIVSSVITKDGFKQVGTTQRIVTGYDTYGNAKYKTLTNKFAVLTIFAITDKATRSKIASIILGPTDAAKLNPTQSTLANLEGKIQAEIFTNDVNDIESIKTETPITVKPPDKQVETVAPVSSNEKTIGVESSLIDFWSKYVPEGGTASSDYGDFVRRGGSFYRTSDNAKAVVQGSAPASVSVAPTSTSSGGNTLSSAARNATTLSAFYQAINKSLPSLSARSVIYQELGLGQASFYTGTAEQNVKLLAALKDQ